MVFRPLPLCLLLAFARPRTRRACEHTGPCTPGLGQLPHLAARVETLSGLQSDLVTGLTGFPLQVSAHVSSCRNSCRRIGHGSLSDQTRSKVAEQVPATLAGKSSPAISPRSAVARRSPGSCRRLGSRDAPQILRLLPNVFDQSWPNPTRLGQAWSKSVRFCPTFVKYDRIRPRLVELEDMLQSSAKTKPAAGRLRPNWPHPRLPEHFLGNFWMTLRQLRGNFGARRHRRV